MKKEVDLAWKTVSKMVDSFYEHLPLIVIGLVIFVIFWIVARVVEKIIKKVGTNTYLDNSLTSVLASIAGIAVKFLGLLVTITIIFPGFSPANLVASLGLTSVAVGFAFKDILQNFLAGLLILWRKPFRLGDSIRSNGYFGVVKEINVRSTKIFTRDGHEVTIPNGQVFTSPVEVLTSSPLRRLKFSVGIGYTDSIEEAREVIGEELRKLEDIVDDPAPQILVSELAASSVNFSVYFWIDSKQTLPVMVDKVATAIKESLDAAKIDMPYPHQVMMFHCDSNELKLASAGQAEAE